MYVPPYVRLTGFLVLSSASGVYFSSWYSVAKPILPQGSLRLTQNSKNLAYSVYLLGLPVFGSI